MHVFWGGTLLLEEGSTLGVIIETGSRMSHSKGLISFSSGICILTRSKMLGLPSLQAVESSLDSSLMSLFLQARLGVDLLLLWVLIGFIGDGLPIPLNWELWSRGWAWFSCLMQWRVSKAWFRVSPWLIMTWSLWCVRLESCKKAGMKRMMISCIYLVLAPLKEASFAVSLSFCQRSRVVQKYFWTFWKLLFIWLSMLTGPRAPALIAR